MKVSELLTGPEKWTKGSAARAAGGMAVGPMDSAAVAFCLEGAISKCYPFDDVVACESIKSMIGCEEIQVWNDAPGRTFEEVREAVLRAGI